MRITRVFPSAKIPAKKQRLQPARSAKNPLENKNPSFRLEPAVIEVNDDEDIPEWAQVLELVREVKTKNGSRIRNHVSEALRRNPPEWAKKILEHSISEEVWKHNSAGQTKRTVISFLENLRCENSPSSSPPPSSSPISPAVDLHVPAGDVPEASTGPLTRPLAKSSSPPLSPAPQVNIQPWLSTSKGMQLPSDAPEDVIHLKDHATKRFKTHRDANGDMPVVDKARFESAPTPFIALTKIVDSAKESFQKLEKDSQKLTSELDFMKSRVEELEQKLELSEAERTNALKLTDFMNTRVEELDRILELYQTERANMKSRVQEIEEKLENSEAKRAECDFRASRAFEAMKSLKIKLAFLQYDTSGIRKEVVETIERLK